MQTRRLRITLGRMLAVCALLVACTSSSSPSSTLPMSSPSSSSSLASSPAGSATADLSFTGLPYLVGTGRVTQTSAQEGTCGEGSVHLAVTVQDRHWHMGVSVTHYHGPGRYTQADGLVVSLASSRELWSGSTGTATYKDDRSLTLDADIENQTAPNSPVAHVAGSMSCA